MMEMNKTFSITLINNNKKMHGLAHAKKHSMKQDFKFKGRGKIADIKFSNLFCGWSLFLL